jgi:hypothetical protein
MANNDQIILKYIIVGRVLMVDVRIKDKLEIKANIYSHHHCLPSKRPGIIISNLVEKAKNSIVFTVLQ